MGCEPLCGGLQPGSMCCLHDLHFKQPQGQSCSVCSLKVATLKLNILSLVGPQVLWLTLLHHMGDLCNGATYSDRAHLSTILQMASICCIHWFCLPCCCYAGTGCTVGGLLVCSLGVVFGNCVICILVLLFFLERLVFF